MITGHCPSKEHLSILGITDSSLCRACMETNEAMIHVMLQCNGVAEQRATHLGSSPTIHKAIGVLGVLLSLWSEFGWLERSSALRPHEQRMVLANQVRRRPRNRRKRKVGRRNKKAVKLRLPFLGYRSPP
ncbi:jg25748 [Pararge aegeria aegeria]|uniref:Jg25748 protein n=1 Tax=Pararge aegeria aegeria TaxID=348720 RepID=A0A8S4QJ37_9NEOP|nr:jg25748 [Pararge aegeria aegeria]